jgi:hypothetical protein
LSISNVNDQLIPYNGGLSPNIGATFLPAETAALNIATYKGYTGSILTSGTTTGNGNLAITAYSYLSGDVVHVKGTAGHQANATQKNYIKNYFSDCVNNVGIEENPEVKIGIHPNPANDILYIKTDAALINADYAINDNLGKTLLVGKIKSENTSIDIKILSKGIYYLSIRGYLNNVMKIVKE